MSAPEPYSAEEVVTLRTDVSYRSLRNGRWFATLKAVARARDAEVRELVEALRDLVAADPEADLMNYADADERARVVLEKWRSVTL